MRGARLQGQASEILEVFENPRPCRRYTIEFTCREFTSLCPLTGQPDFATIIVRYVPGDRCVELKSLKHYFRSFRDRGVFFEDVTNRILDDLVLVCAPVEMVVVGRFNVRGGIGHEITAEYDQDRNA
jgi:7-cyano-7-deazaguanine reductase